MPFSIYNSPVAAGPLRLTNDGHLKRDPTFTNAGKQIVYVSGASPIQLQIMQLKFDEADTIKQKPSPLHEKATKSEFEPAFSRDGRFYAFVQSRGNLSLALVIRDTKLNKDAEIKPGGGFSGLRSPAIAPDNSRVLYCYPENGTQQIFSVNPQAGDKKALTDSPGVNNWPCYTPDGKTIVFGATRDKNYEIYAMDADGKNPRRLTDSPLMDIRPVVSPDGRRIAFASGRDGNREIYVMNLDGTGVRRITHHPERDDYPAWHPDGKRLLIVSERAGRYDLYLVDAAGVEE
ncbi:MAG: PD40 domain-containing protein [Planctomycetes bacterium]|nr:PD40 domain-containing protein [Planctomycetota bacterium]